MFFLQNLRFGIGRKLPVILQTEASECALACLGMVAGFHGHYIDLLELRKTHSISLKGVALGDLIRIAQKLDLASRPVKADMDTLRHLRLPCVLHWDFSHFVVLKEVGKRHLVIHDPAVGVSRVPMEEAARHFTGVALELWPMSSFRKREAAPPIGVRQLMGQVTGLRRSLAQIVALAIALELFAIVSPLLLQWVIDEVVVSADRDLLITLGIGFALLLVLQQMIVAVRGWAVVYASSVLNVQWRTNLFSHLVSLPVQYFEKRQLGDVISRFGATDRIHQVLTHSFLEAIVDGLMSLITLGMMFMYSSLLGSIAVLTTFMYAVVRWIWYGPLQRANEDQIVRSAKQDSHLLETVRGVKTIKLFGRQDERRVAWTNLFINKTNAEISIQRLEISYRLLNGLMAGFENILIICLGAKLVLDGHFTVGALIAFNAYKNQFDSRVTSLIDKVFEARMLGLQTARLADIVCEDAEPGDGTIAVPDEGGDATIRIRQLSFRYAPHEPSVLEDIDLTIGAGESVAITGPSGCGKSTLINLLLGILPPSAGQIFVGGYDTRGQHVKAMRSIVGTVLQDDVLFAGTIEDNICFFDSNPDPAWIRQCAEMAAIHDEIIAMPMGYASLVGDMGTILSGGQKQRILLARAFYKRPRILLLDEATSHLDVSREAKVNESISALNITRVFVAHRMETIATAKRVITIANARIVSDTRMLPMDGRGLRSI